MADSVFFNGTSDALVYSVGSAGFAPGDLTMAMVVKQFDDSTIVEYPMYVGLSTAGSDRYGIYHQTNGRMGIQIGNSVVDAPTVTFRHSGSWILIAVSHASGTTTPRFHSYDWNTKAWIHENGGSTIGDGTAPATLASLGFFVSGTDWFHGYITIAGVWNDVLTDGEVERLINGKWEWDGATVAWRTDTVPPDDAFAGTSIFDNGSGTVSTGNVPPWWLDVAPTATLAWAAA